MKDEIHIDELDVLKQAEDMAQAVDRVVQKDAGRVFRRYPITIALISIFGLGAVLSAVDTLITSISFLNDRPIIVLLGGLIILLITGTLFHRLQNKEINLL